MNDQDFDAWREERLHLLPAALFEALGEGRRAGFLGAPPVAEQVDHSLGFAYVSERSLGRQPRSAADLGTGGGLPGLVLACCWPGTRLVLVEANQRRSKFLALALRRISPYGRAEVRCERAEVAGREANLRETFEVTVARSFGPPAVTAECGSPFLELAGRLIVSEPPEAVRREDRWPESGLTELGLVDAGPEHAGPFGYRVLQKEHPSPGRYPRRTGIPAKRPLFG